jgi:hypothetical protein
MKNDSQQYISKDEEERSMAVIKDIYIYMCVVCLKMLYTHKGIGE